MTQKKKTLHEAFANFFEKPTRETLKTFLKENIGELKNCDFKETWPEPSDLARHIIGIGNSGGGCIIAGVKEAEDKSLISVGLDRLFDKADLINKIKKHLPDNLLQGLEIGDFTFNETEYERIKGKRFQVIFIASNSSYLPFMAIADGPGIKKNRIYIRREGQTDEGNYDEIQKLLNLRIETGYSSANEINLKNHLEQLKILYNEFENCYDAIFEARFLNFEDNMPRLINEDYGDFILRMIKEKKRGIVKLLLLK